MSKLLTLIDDDKFNPGLISNLQNWYDSSDLSTITSSLGKVSKWSDKSGNLRHATQNNSALQPITNSTQINGLNVIDFDGFDDKLDFDNTSIANSEYTILVVTVANSTVTNNWILGGTTALVNQNFHIGHRTNTTVALGHYGNDLDATVASGYSTSPRYLTFKLDSIGKSIRGNGVAIGSNTNNAQLINNNNSSIGKILNLTSYDGSIGEIIIYNKSLSIDEVNLVEQYLAEKWSI